METIENMNVATFTFNGFAENTYVLYDETKECVIVDPGCNTAEERKTLIDFIEANGLKPVGLLNTHCHIDHVLGNQFIHETYKLPLTSHQGESKELAACEMVASMYGIKYAPSPKITVFVEQGSQVKFGNTVLDVLFTPGHSSSSVSFNHKESKQLIAGDVLFQGSIGRTDLPGGNFETLIDSIKQKFFPLDPETLVYPGHGPKTSIQTEKLTNPFLQGN